jgi:hypothetical protein
VAQRRAQRLARQDGRRQLSLCNKPGSAFGPSGRGRFFLPATLPGLSPLIRNNKHNGPKLALLRLDVEDAKIWKSDLGGFIRPAINKLLGREPESGEQEKVAEVSL